MNYLFEFIDQITIILLQELRSFIDLKILQDIKIFYSAKFLFC